MKIGKGTVGRALVAAVTLFSAVGASAAPVSGDFREELSFLDPAFNGKVLVKTGELISGSPDLTEFGGGATVTNDDLNPGSIDVDLSSTGLLRLISRTTAPDGTTLDPNSSYDRIVISITNLMFDFAGQTITGFSVAGGSTLFTPTSGGVNPAPTFGSTTNSLTVTYQTTDATNPFVFVEGGTATFQATFSQPQQVIPEPATGLLLGAGLAMGLVVPRRKAKADSKAPAQA